jgi:hypothetical protein
MRHKGLSFDPFIAQLVTQQLGAGHKAAQIMNEDVKKVESKEEIRENTLLGQQHKAMHEPMLPGPDLYAMNAHVLSRIAVVINKVGSSFESKHLYIWLRDNFTDATTAALFGSRNPFTDDPSLIQTQW